jgi:hypothetical protein
MGWLVGLLRNRGMRHGAVVMSGQLLHRLFKAKPVVATYELKPGETITVSDLGVAEAEL